MVVALVGLAFEKMRRSSANCRWEIWGQPGDILMPCNEPRDSALWRSLESTSAPIIYKKGERGSPWRRPLEDLTLPKGLPFIRKENVGVDIHWLTQFIHVGLKPWRRRTLSKKDHSIVSKAFSVSILRAIRPTNQLSFFIVFRNSWAMMELSWITLPGTKADCHGEMTL